MLDFHLSRFEVDATPPTGHSLCGGWIRPVEGVDDPLYLRGVVLEGAGLPVVLASLDWTGVLNESHRIWTEVLAEVAHTTADRVALHCVHQHNAPFVDREGNRLLREAGASTLLYDERFLEGLMERSGRAVREALGQAQPMDGVATGSAEVQEVACARRVLGADGKIQFTRTSATKDPAARAAPEGVIDPLLRTVSLLQGERVLARLYYYTTHPMSYYGDGRVSADFVGLARRMRDEEEPETLHLYFTGCAGNVTAGKYNDGSSANRKTLAARVHRAMVGADRAARDQVTPLQSIQWRTASIKFQPREDLDLATLKQVVADRGETVVNRNRSAMTCGWLLRLETGRPILLGRLDLDESRILHLPAETFVEYQLGAQKMAGEQFLAVAAYGDGGPWYIPLERSYDEGGYEPSVSWVSRETEGSYRKRISELLGDGAE